MTRTALAALAFLLPTAAAAQGVAPVITPGQAAEGIFARSVAEGQARKLRERQGGSNAAIRPNSRAFQARACANRPMFRRQYGADHPKVQELERLCTKAGY